LEEVLLEAATSVLFEVLGLDVFHVDSLFGRGEILGASSKSGSLVLDLLDCLLDSLSNDFLDSSVALLLDGLSDQLVFRAGFKLSSAFEKVVKALKRLTTSIVDSEVVGESIGGRKNIGAVARGLGRKSSEEWVSPIVELENESVEFLEV